MKNTKSITLCFIMIIVGIFFITGCDTNNNNANQPLYIGEDQQAQQIPSIQNQESDSNTPSIDNQYPLSDQDKSDFANMTPEERQQFMQERGMNGNFSRRSGNFSGRPPNFSRFQNITEEERQAMREQFQNNEFRQNQPQP